MLLKTLLLLLSVVTPQLRAAQMLFGDGISLTTTDCSLYLSVNPGVANAGTTHSSHNETTNVFQILDYDGNNSRLGITYGQTISMQLTSNNLWVTLDPAPGHIRNNVPWLRSWEQLRFVPVTGNSRDPVNYGDHIYLAHTPDDSNFVYAMINEDGSATTTNDSSYATLLVTSSAPFTPYTQARNDHEPITYGGSIYLNGTNGWLNIIPGAADAGTITLDQQTTYTILTSYGGENDGIQVRYGDPISLFTGENFITMNFAPGAVRNNASVIGVWEQLYFIPVSGRNGDFIHDQDTAYMARSGLLSGNFVTEYVTISNDDPAIVATTFNLLDASPMGITFNSH